MKQFLSINIIVLLLISFSIPWSNVQASPDNITSQEEQNEQNTESGIISDTAGFEPETQEEANNLIDEYIKRNFENLYYTEKSSVGEIKLLVKNRYLFTNQNINFGIIQYHIDQSLQFEGAVYTWKVLSGNQELFTLTQDNKTQFYYNFSKAGTYQVMVEARFAGDIVKQGSITLEIFDKVDIDYRPLSPAAGDRITLSTNAIKGQNIIWKVDGSIIGQNKSEVSFTDTKGAGSQYKVELIITDPLTGFTKYYGATDLPIASPEIRYTLKANGLPVDYADSMRFDESTTLSVEGTASGMNQQSRLAYTYRVNDQVVPTEGDILVLDISPNQYYEINLVVNDTNSDKIVSKSFKINEHKQDLEASLDTTVDTRILKISERYWGLLIFGIIGVLGIVLSRFGKAKVE